MKKYLVVVLAAALTLAGCKEKENPVLAVDDISTAATLSGCVKYESPLTINSNGSGLKKDTVALANQVIEVRVAGDKYSKNAGDAMYTFTATTDANGMFAVRVPVLNNSKGLAIAAIQIRPFRLSNYPSVETYTQTEYPYSTTYRIVKKEVYHNGALGVIASPGTLYPNNNYFCGNEVISYTAFKSVGK